MNPPIAYGVDSLSAADVITIHDSLTDWFRDSEDPISPPGVKNREALEAAVARPFQSVDGRDAYPGDIPKSAVFFHGIINNHPFHNGNKRTALVSLHVMLYRANFWLERCTDDDMYEFTTKVAAHGICERREDEVTYINEWIESNGRKIMRGERPLKYHELKDILERFGFTIDPPDGFLLNIYRDGIIVERVKKEGIKGFRPYHTDYVSGLRKRLGLTPENGIDSDKFYGHKGLREIASEMIDLRQDVIKKLAKT
ncbi:MAG: Fic family protein [Tagaea sp.]|nr:Fic family protein [Tagaea sp.]